MYRRGLLLGGLKLILCDILSKIAEQLPHESGVTYGKVTNGKNITVLNLTFELNNWKFVWNIGFFTENRLFTPAKIGRENFLKLNRLVLRLVHSPCLCQVYNFIILSYSYLITISEIDNLFPHPIAGRLFFASHSSVSAVPLGGKIANCQY